MPRKGGVPENLRSWEPGKTGNPKGAPKSWETWAAIMERLSLEPTDAEPPKVETKKERIVRAQMERAMRGDPASTNLIIERTEGKVADKLIAETTSRIVPWSEAAPDDVDEARAAAAEDDEA